MKESEIEDHIRHTEICCDIEKALYMLIDDQFEKNSDKTKALVSICIMMLSEVITLSPVKEIQDNLFRQIIDSLKSTVETKQNEHERI